MGEKVFSPFFIINTMIKFNNVSLSDDGKYLNINASIEDLEYYENMYIASVAIDTQDTYTPNSSNGYSSNPVFKSDVSDLGYKESPKTIDISIDITSTSLSSYKDNLLYIYVGATGYMEGDVPCGKSRLWDMAVAYDVNDIYKNGLSYIKEVYKDCVIPKNFIDYFLRYKALSLAIKTKNFVTANKWWDKLFKGKFNTTNNTNSCGCS